MNKKNTDVLPHMTVNIDSLKADYRYQRPLDHNRVKYIAEHFKASLVRTPIVSQRANGELYIIDGNHTVNILKTVGWKTVQVQYHTGLTVEQESLAFDDLNRNGRKGRLAVPVCNRFNALLVGGAPKETAINKIVQGLGLCMYRNGKRGISAIEALYWAHSNGNLEKTLWTLKKWIPEDSRVYQNDMIRGVSAFYKAYPNADQKHLAKALSPFLPSELRTVFFRTKKSLGLIGASSLGQITTLFDLYNKGLKGRNRLV